MSHSEVKSEVQVARPGQAFPFSSPTTLPHPHISQWCRFTVPEKLPLKPFRQDRLNRLPLPPSIMATSKVASLAGAGSFGTFPHQQMDRRSGDIDPFQKIQQLEKSLIFVRENHAFMLKGLHEEIAELKQKNRELLFELVTGVQALPKDLSENPGRDSPEDQQEKVEKLEKEVRKLRGALKDAMKANSSLSNQLQDIRREQYSKYSSRNQVHAQTANEPPDLEDERPIHSPCGPSPQMEEYTDTLRQIQRASLHGKRDERRHHHDESKPEWSDNYVRNGYQHHHHRHHHHRNQPQKSPQQHQPRLPRLPLRNQQNYSHAQYEIQYRQRSTNSLPALKPLVPVVEHRFDKPRKPRGPRPPKMADQVING